MTWPYLLLLVDSSFLAFITFLEGTLAYPKPKARRANINLHELATSSK